MTVHLSSSPEQAIQEKHLNRPPSYSSFLYQDFPYQDHTGAEFLGCPLILRNFTPQTYQFDQRLGSRETGGLGRAGSVRQIPKHMHRCMCDLCM